MRKSVAVFVFMLISTVSFADIPRMINLQGFLVDDIGPITGEIEATFRIYNASSGGNSLWEETDSVTVNNGLYSVILGQTNPINIVFDDERWIGIQITGHPEMYPRYRQTSLPFAYVSQVSDSSNTISDNAVTSGKIQDGTIQTEDLSFIPAVRPIIDPQIGPGEISNNAIHSDHIINGTIQTEDLSFTPLTRPLNPGVGTSEISDNAVISSKIQDGTVQEADLAFSPVTRPISPGITTSEISNNAVNSSKIINGSVQLDDLNQNGAAPGQVMKWNGSQWTAANDSVGVFTTPPTAGIASTHTSVSTILNITSMTDIATVSITIPNDGYIFVQGRCRITFDNGSTVLPISAYLQIDETPGGLETVPYYILAGLTGTQNLGYADYIPVYVDRVYQKSAGTYIFRLEGRGGGGDPSSEVRAGSQSITAIYIPNAMGDITVSENAENNGR